CGPSTGIFAPKAMTRLHCGGDGCKPDQPKPSRRPSSMSWGGRVFSPGPKLNIDGKVLTTHLCLILDDHSRLITEGAYYLTADSYAFHQTLKQAVQRRGIPYKLYTDQGKPFTNKHTQIICANLGIRLLHAKPYAVEQQGKVERCFYTLQQGFESTLKLPDNRAQSLEELNTKLTHWI